MCWEIGTTHLGRMVVIMDALDNGSLSYFMLESV